MEKQKYHFLRLEWEIEEKMDEALNKLLLADERVVSITCDGSDVLVLVEVLDKFRL